MSRRILDGDVGLRLSTWKYNSWWLLLAFLLVTDRAVAGDSPTPPRLSTEQQQRLKERDRLAEEIQRLRAQGKLIEAQAAAAKRLAIEREVFGSVHEDVADSLDQLANFYLEQDEFAKARAAYEEGLTIRIKLYGEGHYSVTDARWTLADVDLRSRLSAEERRRLRRARELTDQSQDLSGQSRYPQASELLQKALIMRRALYPPDKYPQGHRDLAMSLNNLGSSLQAQGDYSKAEPFLYDALTMRRTLYPPEKYPQGHPDLATSLNNLGYLLWAQGDYGKAEPFYREALTMRRALYPTEKYPHGQPDLATSLNDLGSLFQLQGDYGKAEAFYREALTMWRALYPPEKYPQGHPDLAASLNNLGSLLQAQGDYGKAEPFLREALTMWRAFYSPEKYPQGHPDLAASLNNLGSLLQAQGDYGKAEPFLREALTMRRALYPAEKYPQGHPDLAASLNNLGLLLHVQGDYVKAEPFLREALTMRRALYSTEKYPQGQPDLAASLNSLGYLLSAQGDYGKAEPFYREALTMWRALYLPEKYPQGHPDLATSVNNLGSLLHVQGEYGKAEAFYREALTMWRALYPPKKYPQGHPNLTVSLSNLGFLLQAQGDYGKAEPFKREALTMRRALYPPKEYPQGHPDLATSLNDRASLLQAQGDYGKAEPFYREALTMRRALYPPKKYPQGHPDLATSLHNLASLLQAQGDYGKAEPFFREALTMWRALYSSAKYPQGHPDLAMSLHDLGSLFQAQGDYAKAKLFCEQALSMHLNLAMLHADAASDIQGLNYLTQLPATRDLFLSLPHGLLQTSPDAIYAALWRGRSALTRLLERRQQALLAAHDPATRELTEQLLSTRRQLARLLLAPASDAKNHERRLKDLSDRKEDLQRQLARLIPRSVLPLDQDAPPHSELVQQLPERTVFIDVLRYRRLAQDPNVRGRKGASQTAHYVAFMLRKGQPAQRVGLGPAKPIEDALADWRQAIADWGTHPESRRRLEDRATLASQTLRRLIWEPLVHYLPEDTETVYLAPDAALTRLPWAALPGKKKGTVLLEELTLAVVPHGPFLLRSLTRPAAQPDPKADLLLTVCGVSYGQRPELLAAAKDNLLTVRSPVLAPQGVHWSDLPGTEAEVNRILELTGPRLRRDLRATAASTTQLEADLPRARWAHLATHGFFADSSFRSVIQLDEQLFAYAGIRDRNTVGARNPLVLSGLVLAGANLPPGKDQDRLTYDQGIATAETLTSLDLRKLELVVLSACETGLGDVAGGEGVFGLQRAFHLAGTRNVIASLWKVDDLATAALMERFYQALWQDKKPPLVALREAQLAMLRGYDHRQGRLRGAGERVPFDPKAVRPAPPRSGELPPYYWAGFVLSGDGR